VNTLYWVPRIALLITLGINVAVIAFRLRKVWAENKPADASTWSAADWCDTSPREEWGSYTDGIEVVHNSPHELFAADPLGSWVLPPELVEETPLWEETWQALVDSGALTGVGAEVDWDLEMINAGDAGWNLEMANAAN
jgi:hypothetical protein